MHKTISVIGILLWLGLAYMVTAIVERLIMDKVMTRVYGWKPGWKKAGIIDIKGKVIA